MGIQENSKTLLKKKKKEYNQINSNNLNVLKKEYIFGWNNLDDLAREVWNSIHCILLKGIPIFAYKDHNGFQVVIVKNEFTNQPNDFAIGMMTQGYTMLLPHIPIEYLCTCVLDDLKSNKIEKRIIEIYEHIIEDYKNEIISN